MTGLTKACTCGCSKMMHNGRKNDGSCAAARCGCQKFAMKDVPVGDNIAQARNAKLESIERKLYALIGEVKALKSNEPGL